MSVERIVISSYNDWVADDDWDYRMVVSGEHMVDAAPAISVRELRKSYGEVRAVDGITFEVKQGEIFGLLGHNGAGKTTTIRMLTGRTRPTSGDATVLGLDVVANLDQIKPQINLVFEDQNLYERLSGRYNLQMFAELYGAPEGRVDALLAQVSLAAVAKRRVKSYSS